MLTFTNVFQFRATPWTCRHYFHVRILASDLTKAVYLPTVETRGLNHRSSPEINIIGVQGGKD